MQEVLAQQQIGPSKKRRSGPEALESTTTPMHEMECSTSSLAMKLDATNLPLM